MMVYFRCFECDGRWTKLIKDGCPRCDGPCQIIESLPFSGSADCADDILPNKESEDGSENDSIAQHAYGRGANQGLGRQVDSTFTIFSDDIDDALQLSGSESKTEYVDESVQIAKKLEQWRPLDEQEYTFDSEFENTSFSSYELSDQEIEKVFLHRLKSRCDLASAQTAFEPSKPKEVLIQKPEPNEEDDLIKQNLHQFPKLLSKENRRCCPTQRRD